MTVSCIYEGAVVHQRIRPRPHGLRYRVFSFLLDVDQIDAVASRLGLFSRNRWNVSSFHDCDHGDKTGRSVADYARRTLLDAGLSHAAKRILLLSYPRVCGFGFNPISVYYCYDADDVLGAVIYEVNNTFGERRSYVVAIQRSDQAPATTVHAHSCAKELYVSPFTDMNGWYQFRLREPGPEIAVGVALRDRDGPVLRTHFTGSATALTDANIARATLRIPFLSLKVVAGIHWEALLIWWKGVPFTVKPAAPPYSVTHTVPVRHVPTSRRRGF